jgi:hypothetical protein
MKNVKMYHGKELINYIGSLWHTEEFKNAHNDEESPIYKCIRKVANMGPLWFYDMSDQIERTQFSSWWRHIQTRHYDIPAVTDLHYYHELTHISNHRTTNYNYEVPNPDEWQNYAFDEEIIASLESEVFIYWYFPTLRAKTFKFEIWADRLSVPTPEKLENAKWNARAERVRIFREPNFDDPIEMSIHKYNNQNLIWCGYWKNVCGQINDALRRLNLHSESEDTINPKAIEMFEDMIKRNTTDGVVFRKETRLFHEYTKDSIITIFKG